MKIYKKLLEVKKELGSISKDAANNFHKYKYATLSNILKNLNPLLEKNGLFLKIEDTKLDENTLRFWLTIIDTSTGEFTRAKYDVDKDKGNSNPVQAFGSTMTYGQRYILGAFFGIPFDDEDPDTKSGEVPTLTVEERKEIQQKANDLGITSKMPSLIKKLGFNSSKDIPQHRLPELLNLMENLK